MVIMLHLYSLLYFGHVSYGSVHSESPPMLVVSHNEDKFERFADCLAKSNNPPLLLTVGGSNDYQDISLSREVRQVGGCDAVIEQHKNLTAELNKRKTQYQKLQQSYLAFSSTVEKGCVREVTGFGNPVTQRNTKRWQPFGMWTKDMLFEKDGRIWVTVGQTINEVLEYDSLAYFKTDKHYKKHVLPFSCDGNGFAVYGGYFYCNKADSRTIAKYDLVKNVKVVEQELPGAGYRDTFPYQYKSYSDIDIMADEWGIWAIYSSASNNGKIIISKLSEIDLSIQNTWNTNFPKTKAANAIMICGTLFVINADTTYPSYVIYTYDTTQDAEQLLPNNAIMFDNTDTSGIVQVESLRYNPQEKKLYGWSWYRQYTYDVFRT